MGTTSVICCVAYDDECTATVCISTMPMKEIEHQGREKQTLRTHLVQDVKYYVCECGPHT